MNRTLKVPVLCLFILAFVAAIATAQEISSPEKKELIKELYRVSQADKIAEQTAVTIVAQMEVELPKLITRSLETRRDLTKKQKAEVLSIATQSASRVSKRVRELLPEKINFSETMEQVFFPLYDKYFTESELKELVAFYKSPIGQKSISVTPALLNEAMEISNRLFTPKVLEMVNEILEEEQRNLPNKK